MSNFGGPASAFEKDLNARLNPLKVRLIKLENKMSVTIGRAIKNGKKSNAYWSAVNKEINSLKLVLRISKDSSILFSFLCVVKLLSINS